MKRLTARKEKQKTLAQYRFFQALYMAFYHKRLYLDVIKNWRGFGLLYLLLMLSILVLPHALEVAVKYQQFVTQEIFLPVKKLPPLSVRQGEVQFYSPMPYLVRNDEKEVISIIDTTGKITALPSIAYPKASVLVTKDALHFSFPPIDLFHMGQVAERKESVSPLNSHEDIDFLAEDWLKSTNLYIFSKLLLLAFYPILWMFYFGLCVVLVFALAFFGQLMARLMFKVRLSYKASVRLMSVALTPAAWVYFTLLALMKIYTGMGMVYVALMALYFCFGVLAYRRESRKLAIA